MAKTIAIDVDGVLADTHTEWLKRYNHDWKDSIAVDDIKSWEIHRYVKCGHKIYEYLDYKNLYQSVLPIQNSFECVSKLREMGYHIIYVTDSYPPIQMMGKFKWLKDWGYLDPQRLQKDFYVAHDKSKILCDYLIDDRVENVKNCSGTGIIFSQPWNKGYLDGVRLDGWGDYVVEYFKNELEK